MSYQVLARKWRPRTLEDMVGQESIRRMLANALKQNRIHHAYLFTGTRGVGKTTIGRILAKCLNCTTGITATPCDTCHSCKAIDAGQFLDLYEIDAASRTKVEDMRELLENVPYPPTEGRYKIYLIDEVHMLSNHSFNALLKTLEEPPEHVKFLLATTDPKRLPITILSRCLQFHLKRIPTEQITKHLQSICTKDNITHDVSALEKLAKAADGSLRDAMSLLDQAIAFGNGCVLEKEIAIMLGTIAKEDLLPLLQALALADNAKLFALITQLAERAVDFSQLLDELIRFFHQIALAQMLPDINLVGDDIKTLASAFSPEDVQLFYQIALLGKRDIPYAATEQQGFEMTILRMLAFKPTLQKTRSTKESAPIAVEPKSHAISNVNLQTASHDTLIQHQTSSPPPEVETSSFEKPKPEEWRELLPKLELSGMAYALAANCHLIKNDDHQVELSLSQAHEPMLNAKLKDRIADALNRYYKQPKQLSISITTTEIVTPAKQHQSAQLEKLAKAKQTALENPLVKQFIEMYDATVEVSLV